MDISTIQSAMVRFRTRSGKVVGAGFLVADRHVLTCAHVVNAALGKTRNNREHPAEPVLLDFPYHAAVRAMAQVDRWFFKPPDHKTDIAILRLDETSPPGARVLALSMKEDNLWGEEAGTFGFPEGYPDGVGVEGEYRAVQAGGLLQLDASATTQFFVEEGFSGAPAWDGRYQCTGMVVSVAHVRTAFLIPAHQLAQALQRQASARPPAQTMSHVFPKATQLIRPYVTTPKEREILLTQAYYQADRPLYEQLFPFVPEPPLAFTTTLLRTAWEAKCTHDGYHPISLFLTAICLVCDEHAKNEIAGLTAELDAQCGMRSPEPGTPIYPTAPAGELVTITTPPPDRALTIFVSYAHEDEDFARRLIADLQAAGHTCWIDTIKIKGGDEWVRAITEGINNSYAFVSIVSKTANESQWVQREYLWAEKKRKPRFPVLAEECIPPIYMIDLQHTALHRDYQAGLRALLDALPPPPVARRAEEAPQPRTAIRPANQRAMELEYLDFLRLTELVNTEKYTPLAGTAHVRERTAPRGQAIEPVVIRPEFELLRRRSEDEQFREVETRRFEDIVGAIQEIRRAVVLGEPGAGKTTTLWKLARTLVDAALQDPEAPLPVLARLGRWENADQSLHGFLADELGGLGAFLDELLASKRAVLLLDGLNEVPVAQREEKAQQVQALFNAHPDLTTVMTCREQDYTLDLGFDRIVITPLDPLRIREFVTRYLGDPQGEALFWRLAGGDEVRRTWEAWQRAGATFELFWNAADVPRDDPDVYHETSLAQDNIWRSVVHGELGRRSLLNLARNPYMLQMMTDVYALDGDLPANRGKLFARFVETLLEREHIIEEGPALLDGLARLAYEMQIQRAGDTDGSAVTVLSRQAAARFLGERQFYLANSASILGVDTDSVRFTHQLLQEYFAAVYMRGEIEAGRLRASDIWPRARWWQRTGWEEAAVLLAGLYSDNCTPVLEWVAAANPEVAAQCVLRSGAYTPPETLEDFRAAWIPRLTDLEHDPQPEARAAVGRALGLLDLDDRHGVGLREDGLPDIDWVEIPEGEFIYQDGERLTLPAFYIARYPVTYRQFQAFIDAHDGFYNPRWWEGLAADDEHKAAPREQAFKFSNHPRERVSWWDAVAFCRWLGAKLGYEILLPSEQEWEKAARGTDGREYPWGEQYISGYANVDETFSNQGAHNLGQTSAVGVYPQGASPFGALDMSGNVWEWCLNTLEGDTDVGGTAARVLRGGSWSDGVHLARGASRYWDNPDDRNGSVGFRVVCSAPMA